MSTLYEDLGVSKEASKEEIRKAYKSKANKCHPDKKGGCTESFKSLVKAYTILHDPKLRDQYDRTGNPDVKSGESLVMSTLATIFLALINQEAKGDLIQMAKVSILKNTEHLKDKRCDLVKEKAKIENKLGRITTSKPFNLFDNLLNDKIKEVSASLDQMKEAVNCNDLMLDILVTYRDEKPDIEKPVQYTTSAQGWGNNTRGSTL